MEQLKISTLISRRKIDVEQIVGQLVKKLSLLDQIEKPGKPVWNWQEKMKQVGSVCLTKYLSTKFLNLFKGVRGFAIESGSPTSHLATLFKSLEVPNILGLQEHNELIEHGRG